MMNYLYCCLIPNFRYTGRWRALWRWCDVFVFLNSGIQVDSLLTAAATIFYKILVSIGFLLLGWNKKRGEYRNVFITISCLLLVIFQDSIDVVPVAVTKLQIVFGNENA